MKQLRNILKVAMNSILKNRARSLLTSLGIIIGVSAVIVMVAIGEGSSARIQKQIADLGANLLVVFPGSASSRGVSHGAGSFNRMTMDDVEKLKEEATLLQWVSPMIRSGGQVIGGGNNWNTQIAGVSPEYLLIRDWSMETGTFFTERDVRTNKKVAVLGKTVVSELYGDSDPIGETIRIRNVPFKVIGTLAEKGQTGMGNDQDDVILAPSNTVLYRLKGGRYIDMIYASGVSTELLNDAQEEMQVLLRESQKLRSGEEDSFMIRNQAEITQTVSEMSRIMTMLLGSIAGVSLIVGGIGIMNIMLVSVTERTREIGIRKAIGASRLEILWQFITEAVILSGVGGVVGIIFGVLSGILLGVAIGWPTTIPVLAATVGFVFSSAVGLFFGIYPAVKASQLNPIEALRYE